MHQKQLAQIPELTNCNIGTSCSLQAFHTTDANTDVSSLDHRNIVGSVANSEQNGLLLVLLDQFHDQSFL